MSLMGQFHHLRKRLLRERDGHGAASRYEETPQPADVGEMSGAGPINVAFALAANLAASDDNVAVPIGTPPIGAYFFLLGQLWPRDQVLNHGAASALAAARQHHLPFTPLGHPTKRGGGGSPGQACVRNGSEKGRVVFAPQRPRADPAVEQLLQRRVLLQKADERAGVFLGRRLRRTVDVRMDDVVAPKRHGRRHGMLHWDAAWDAPGEPPGELPGDAAWFTAWPTAWFTAGLTAWPEAR